MAINNLLDSISSKVNTIVSNVSDICEVIKKHDKNTSVKNISHFNKVASEIDRIITFKGLGCCYLNNYIAQENEICFQVALYRSSKEPTIRVKLKSDKWYMTTNNGTSIMENTSATTNNKFILKNFISSNETENEEGWKPVTIRIISTTPIESITITSDVPIMALSANLPSFYGKLTDIFDDLSHLRASTLRNIKNANNLFSNCNRLKKVDLDLSQVFDLRNCFGECNDIVEIYNLNLSNANTCEGMFDGCKSLRYVEFDPNSTVPSGLDFSECSSLNLDRMVAILNNLPLNAGKKKNIFIPVGINLSTVQLDSFRAKGYEIVWKVA